MLSNKENTSCVIDQKVFNCTKKEFPAYLIQKNWNITNLKGQVESITLLFLRCLVLDIYWSHSDCLSVFITICVLPHQHWYWFTYKSKWHMCTYYNHLEWLLTLAIWGWSFENKKKNLECVTLPVPSWILQEKIVFEIVCIKILYRW